MANITVSHKWRGPEKVSIEFNTTNNSSVVLLRQGTEDNRWIAISPGALLDLIAVLRNVHAETDLLREVLNKMVRETAGLMSG